MTARPAPPRPADFSSSASRPADFEPIRPPEPPSAADFDEDIEDARTEQVDIRTLQRPADPAPPRPPPPRSPPAHATPIPAPTLEARPRPSTGQPAPARERSPHPSTASAAPRAVDPLRRGAWASRVDALADEDLDAFSDNDYDRSSTASGRFSSEARNLDRVEVVAMVQEDAGSPPDPHRTDTSGPRSRYAAPPLTPSEAMTKVRVANEVLSAVAEAFDEVLGVGRGPLILQSLVDSAPPAHASVLYGLRVNDLGELPQTVVLRNLQHRPPPEHRLLLNNTLIDLVERSLSIAADDLPEDVVDRVVEIVGGYRQRMGL